MRLLAALALLGGVAVAAEGCHGDNLLRAMERHGAEEYCSSVLGVAEATSTISIPEGVPTGYEEAKVSSAVSFASQRGADCLLMRIVLVSSRDQLCNCRAALSFKDCGGPDVLYCGWRYLRDSDGDFDGGFWGGWTSCADGHRYPWGLLLLGTRGWLDGHDGHNGLDVWAGGGYDHCSGYGDERRDCLCHCFVERG